MERRPERNELANSNADEAGPIGRAPADAHGCALARRYHEKEASCRSGQDSSGKDRNWQDGRRETSASESFDSAGG
jgi:hypothetical protein